MHFKKVNNSKLILAIVALLITFAVAMGVTYSWIEGGTTYTMETLKNSDIKLGDFDETYAGKIILDPARSDKVTLLDYDKTVDDYQSLIFTPVSTADGNDFYFPSSFDAEGNPLSYKVATTNDIGTKFVNFSVDVKAARRCYLAFNGEPEVVVTKSGKEVTDTSAFRVMISSEMHNVSNFFSTGAEGNVDGVTSISGTTSEYALESFSKYQDNSITTVNRLYQYEENDEDTLTVSVWLDSLADYADLCGCDVSLNLQLIVGKPKAPIKFNAVTYDNEGNKDTNNGFTGGKIAGRTEAFTDYAAVGESYIAKATPGANYNFEGWFDNAECNGTPINENKNYTFTVTDDSISLFAKFVEKPEYTITVNQKTLPNGTGGSVYIDKAGTTSLTNYDGNTADIYATPEDGYRFLGWYTDESCTGSSVSAEQQYTVKFGENEPKTYYAKFAKEYTVTFNTRTDGTVGGAGGYVNIDSAATTATSKAVTSYYGQTLKLYTKTVEGYNFNGIFKDGVADSLGTTNPTEITVNSDATYFADFTIKTYTVTYKIFTNGEASNSGGQISFDGSNWSSSELQNSSVTHGQSVSFHAKANDTYKLDKIYLSTNESTTVTSGNSVEITGDVTYIANFVPDSKPTTIYIEPRSGYSSYYVWLWDSNNNYTGGTWPGTQAAYDDDTGYYKLVIDGPDSGNFNIIINNNNGSETGTKTGTFGNTYLFTSGNDSFYTFNPNEMKTIYIGVVEHQNGVSNEDTLRLHWWSSNSTYQGNVDPTYIGEHSYSPGSGYWSGSKQKFYMYKVKVPAEAINMKAWADNSSDTWYGGDSVISEGNCLMLFEYGNTYYANQITYNP